MPPTMQLPAETANSFDILATRDVVVKDPITKAEREEKFKVLVVDRPDKWKAAADCRSEFLMAAASGTSQRKMRFKFTGFSYARWTEIEFLNTLPDPPVSTDTGLPDEKDEEYLKDYSRVLKEKKIDLYEEALGVKLPGETKADKVAWLDERAFGDMEALFYAIHGTAAGFTSGSSDEFLATFVNAAAKADNSVIDFSTPESWEAATSVNYYYRTHHQNEDFITEFPLRGITQKQKEEIESQTKSPEPPKIFGRNEQGRLDPKKFTYNYNDVTYQRNMAAIVQKRITLTLEACLVFEIPGSSMHGKYEWIAQRLAGDVHGLDRFIRDNIMGLGERFDSFTNG